MTPEEVRQYVAHLRALRTSSQSFNKSINLDAGPAKPKKPRKSVSVIDADKLGDEYGV